MHNCQSGLEIVKESWPSSRGGTCMSTSNRPCCRAKDLPTLFQDPHVVPPRHCPKGARHIWIVREPCAVAYSFFNMVQGWFFQPGELSLEDYMAM